MKISCSSARFPPPPLLPPPYSPRGGRAHSTGQQFLHDNRIIHRDLKPGNVLVTKNCQLRITDFGLARLRPMGRGAHPDDEVRDCSDRGSALLHEEETRCARTSSFWCLQRFMQALVPPNHDRHSRELGMRRIVCLGRWKLINVMN